MNTSQLTFTRFIAAVLIVFFHYHHGVFSTNINFIEVLKNNFDLGVSYFYVLSGFVMMLAYGKKTVIDPRQYYINRFARIYPLHIFSSILFIVVSILISLNYLDKYHFPALDILIKQILLIHAWFPLDTLTINFVAWSISVEMFFYICFPYLFNFFIQKYSLKTVSVVVFSFWVISQIYMNWFYLSHPLNIYDESFLMSNPLLHLNQFCIGLLLGKCLILNHSKLNGSYDITIIIFVSLTIVMIYGLRNFFVHNGLFAINFALIIFLMSINEGFITKLFRKKVFIYLGEISFAIYLLQAAVFDFSLKVFKVIHLKNAYLAFFSSLMMLIIAAHFTYKWIEIPLKNKIRNKLSH